MAKNSYYITGKVNWCKILGDPVPNYGKDGFEWTMDVTPDENSMKTLQQIGLDSRLKNKGDDRGDFITFKQKATRANGQANNPIRVVDAKNRPWNPEDKIGNGSVIDLKFNVVPYGPGKHDGVYPQAVRVLDHVSYVPQDFAELPEDNEYVKKADENPHVAPDFEKDFGLDDDVE